MRLRRYCYWALMSAWVLGAATALFWTIQARRSVPLTNGYRCYFFDAGARISLDFEQADKARVQRFFRSSDLRGIGPNVDGYRVYRRIIVGHVSHGAYDNPTYRYKDKQEEDHAPGYFILNPRTDRSYNALGKREWLRRLRSYGVTSEPKLFRPSVFDGYRGRNRPTND